MSDSEKSNVASSWDTYWQGTGDVGAFSSGGVNHPAIAAFWQQLFPTVLRADSTRGYQIVDVATGNGAVIELMLAESAAAAFDVTCVDISPAAIENVKQRFGSITGIVADAKAIPLEDQSFDLVCSQFGVEYAGLDAVLESARLVARGGSLAMLMHIEGGVVHEECTSSLNAINEMQTANFVPLAIDFFTAGFAAVGGGPRAAYDDAGRLFAPAIEAAEKTMQRYGTDVAGETIFRLYNDVGNIHSQLPKYVAEDVLAWLRKMQLELVEYAERMSSMTASATSEQRFQALCDELQAAGFVFSHREPLLPTGENTPVAWVLVAERTD